MKFFMNSEFEKGLMFVLGFKKNVMMSIKIFIVDDYFIFLEGLKCLFW